MAAVKEGRPHKKIALHGPSFLYELTEENRERKTSFQIYIRISCKIQSKLISSFFWLETRQCCWRCSKRKKKLGSYSINITPKDKYLSSICFE
jgi:hypothetical protein